jgi:hypothetical protein
MVEGTGAVDGGIPPRKAKNGLTDEICKVFIAQLDRLIAQMDGVEVPHVDDDLDKSIHDITIAERGLHDVLTSAIEILQALHAEIRKEKKDA